MMQFSEIAPEQRYRSFRPTALQNDKQPDAASSPNFGETRLKPGGIQPRTNHPLEFIVDRLSERFNKNIEIELLMP